STGSPMREKVASSSGSSSTGKETIRRSGASSGGAGSAGALAGRGAEQAPRKTRQLKVAASDFMGALLTFRSELLILLLNRSGGQRDHHSKATSAVTSPRIVVLAAPCTAAPRRVVIRPSPPDPFGTGRRGQNDGGRRPVVGP